MKKLLLLGVLLSLSTGCGRGWMPCLFRGASCGNAGCIGAAPALPQGCNACVGGNSAGYSSYDGDTIVGDTYAMAGERYVGEGPAANYGSGAISAPSMAPLPARAP